MTVTLEPEDGEPQPTPRAFLASTYPFPEEGIGANTTPVRTNWTGPIDENNDLLNTFFFYESIQFAVMWLLFVAIVLGNTSVIAALFFNKTRKSRMNYFIMHLAIADLCVGLISVLTDIVQKMTIVWLAGNVACKLIRFLQCVLCVLDSLILTNFTTFYWTGLCNATGFGVSYPIIRLSQPRSYHKFVYISESTTQRTHAVVTYSSTYVLVALSIDRCDAITHPMNFSGSWNRARGLIASAWLLSILFSIPILLLYEVKTIQGQLQCWIDLGSPRRWQIYMTGVSVTVLVLPALTIAACYTVIVLTIWTKSKAVMSPPITSRRKKNQRLSDADFDSRRASSRGLIPRAKIKSVKMTFVIVFVFILCWSPYMVFDLLQVYDCIPRTQTSIAVATLIQSLAPLNSAANPLICCMFSPHIYASLRRVPPYRWLCLGRNRARATARSHSDSTALSELLTSSHRRAAATMLNSSMKRYSVRLDSTAISMGGRSVRMAPPPVNA